MILHEYHRAEVYYNDQDDDEVFGSFSHEVLGNYSNMPSATETRSKQTSLRFFEEGRFSVKYDNHVMQTRVPQKGDLMKIYDARGNFIISLIIESIVINRRTVAYILTKTNDTD